MEGVENTANNATKEVKGFVQHLLKFDNDTQADMTNLNNAGYPGKPTELEDGVIEYLSFLDKT